MSSDNWGAEPGDWERLAAQGLTEDLLPVVSNPKAKISELSKMKDLGKTPSIYNGTGEVAGIPSWTSKRSTAGAISRWSAQPDYGICIQTRNVRALDLDITDAALATAIAGTVKKFLGSLPERFRSNSSKSLFAFRMPGDFTKRVIRTAAGIIEFLATGQQFIAYGTHPSGARYEWQSGPELIPEVNEADFELLWLELERVYAVEPSTSATASVKSEKLAATSANDPVAVFLHEHGFVLDEDRKTGRLDIVCPFVAEHTGEGAPSATSYFPANTGGYALGHFDCKHAHCERRSDDDFKDKLGIPAARINDFENLAEAANSAAIPEVEETAGEADDDLVEGAAPSAAPASGKPMFRALPAGEFAQRPAPGWIVKNILPHAELAVIYGPPGSGKSFAVLDMTSAIAAMASWREMKVKGGKVAYVAAEGAGGFRNRLVAFSEHTTTDLGTLELFVIDAAPNLMEREQALGIAKAVIAAGGASVIVVDTLAKVLAGGNENSGEDIGKVLAHCHGIHRATGALVVLVHHTGKDESKGARGHSSIKGNADTELEVYRVDQQRVLAVSKQKDGRDGGEYGFHLVETNIGYDRDGDSVTSCVVVSSDRIPQKQKPRKGASPIPPAEGGGDAIGDTPTSASGL